MSKPVRNSEGKYAQRKPFKILVAWWASALFSLIVLWLAARAVMGDLGGFRGCNGDTPVGGIVSCGKQSLTLGDLILIGLFVLSVSFAASLTTAAWRATRKGSVLT